MVFIIDHTIKHILHKFPLLLHLLMLHRNLPVTKKKYYQHGNTFFVKKHRTERTLFFIFVVFAGTYPSIRNV